MGINAWVAHSNPQVYGADPEIFRPERWLEDPKIVKAREAYFMTVCAAAEYSAYDYEEY